MDKMTRTKRFIEWTKRKFGTPDNTGTHHALLIDLVLMTLFNFLDTKDLQSCRLVCSKWEQISRSYFVKRSKVFITGDGNSQALDTFKETFCDASVMPFTKFCFQGFFPVIKFESFLNSWPTIQELFLESISLADTDGRIYTQFALNYSIFLKLKTLSFNFSIGNFRKEREINRSLQSTGLVVRFSQIRSIKNLYLNGTYMLISDGQICPEELVLQGHINFARNLGEEPVAGPNRLNDFIDLKNVRKMGVSKQRNHAQHLTIDVTDCQRLENLSHHSGTLVGLSPQSKIRQLRISTLFDLSLLPVHLEVLELGKNHEGSCTGEVNLPNLKRLTTFNDRLLSRFLNCPNLTDLIIGDSRYYSDPVPIPLRVSRMSLNPWHVFRSDDIVHLDYLHMELPLWNLSLGLGYLEIFQTQTLVITFKSNPIKIEHNRATLRTSKPSMAELISIVELQSARGGIVVLGGIEWNADCHSFIALVDQKSEFYLFANGKGRGIDEVEFEKLIQLKRDSVFLV